MAEFSPEAHEAAVSERYERLAKYEVIDRIIDLALDGVVTMPEALAECRAQWNCVTLEQPTQ